MADGVSFDFSEFDKLLADLDAAPGKTAENVIRHLDRMGKKVQDDWREPLKGSSTVPGGAGAVTYDIRGSASVLLGKSAVEAEVGPVLRGQGPIVGMLEDGTPNTGPRGFGLQALKKNEDAFADGIQKAGDVL